MAPTEVLAGQHARSVAALLEGVGAANHLNGPATANAARRTGVLARRRSRDRRRPATGDADLRAADLGRHGEGPDAHPRRASPTARRSRDRDPRVGAGGGRRSTTCRSRSWTSNIDSASISGWRSRARATARSTCLIMTATPIPRTLALTYYGDLDVVVLDEMPKGRQPIGTAAARSDEERAAAYDLVRREVRAGRQAFVVCAAIDEGNRTQVRAAEAEAERLATEVFPDLAGRAAPRADAAEGQRARDGGLPLRPCRRAHLDDRDRGRRRRPERDGHVDRERRTVRPRPAPSAARPDRPRRERVLLRPVRRIGRRRTSMHELVSRP